MTPEDPRDASAPPSADRADGTVVLDREQLDAISARDRPRIGPRVRVHRTGVSTRVDPQPTAEEHPNAGTLPAHGLASRGPGAPSPPAPSPGDDDPGVELTLPGLGRDAVAPAVARVRHTGPQRGDRGAHARPGPGAPLSSGGGPETGAETLSDDVATDATMADESHPDTSLDAKIRRQLEEDNRPREDPLLGQVIGGRFEVLSKIGAGGMGAVYRARQRGIDRQVAIKVLLEDMARSETVSRRFTIEALAVSRLKHPHTIQIFDFGKTDQGNPYIAMELLEGRTLYDLLKEQPRLPIRRALRIIAGVAGSLSEAHGKEIIHRDLKPENIFLTRVGGDPDFVKVLDFGVAKLRDGAGDGKGTLTKAGSIFGTPRYMSPEQASARPVDARSDLYSLGVILYEMVAGRAPFVEDTPLHLLLAHANKPPPPPCVVSPELAIPREVETLIMRLLDKSPHCRLQTAVELAAECSRLANTLPEAFDTVVPLEEATNLPVDLSTSSTLDVPDPAPPTDTEQAGPTRLEPPALSPDPRPTGGRRRPLVLALAGGLCALAVGLVLLRAERRPPPSPAPRPAAPATSLSAAPAPAPPDAVASVAPPDAGPEMMRVSVVTRPAGARVVELPEDGAPRELGTAPFDLRRPKGSRLKIRIEHPHHRPEERLLHFMYNETLDVALFPTPRGRARSQKRRPKTRRPKASSSPRDRAEVQRAEPKKPPGGVSDILVDDLL